jgi:hypothetical protein
MARAVNAGFARRSMSSFVYTTPALAATGRP